LSVIPRILGSIVERRLLTFIVASTAFFMVYLSLRMMFAPPRPPQGAELAGEAAEMLVDDGEAVSESETAATPAETVEKTGESEQEDEPAPQRPDRPQWLTLGSMEADSGYYLLVTVNSRGGGIERIEMTERDDAGLLRYRRVDVRHGYLGYFAGEPAPDVDGVLVNVVGPGTPGDVAGIEVGDVIVSVNGRPVRGREEIDQALIGTKPGESTQIELLRGESTTPRSLEATLSEHPLDLVRLARDGGADQIVGNLSRPSCLLTLSQVNRKSIEPSQRSISGMVDPMELNWNVTPPESESASEQSAEFTLELSGSEMEAVGGQAIRMKRRYSLAPASYDLGMLVQLDNLSEQAQDLAYRLEGANGITLEGWWYSNKISPQWRGGAAARDVVCKTPASGHRLLSGYTLLSRTKKEEKDPNQTIFAGDSSEGERQLRYIGVDAQYFTVAYLPPEGSDALTDFRRASAGIAADAEEIPRHQERAVNTTFYLDSVVKEVPAGGSMRQQLRLFAGPKQPELLAQYGLQDCIYYGWFSRFSKILAWLLHLLSHVGNYAVAIVLLTVIVRGGMFPLSRKAAINAQKMQELAPEIKKINEKFKDDMEGKLKAQRELQQRVGFNPLAGCLPMFLQLPIFIGLYRALSVDIELRQAAVSSATDWASNLAAPDMFLYWGDWLWSYLSGRGTGWLGPYFNLLPVIVVTLFLAQQKMFMPPATDEQTAMTQKMMNVMTLMMGLFFFRVPAGLCIYFITSSLWGICERIMVKKTLPTAKHFDAAVLEGTAAPSQKSQTLVERLRSQVAKPEMPVERPNKRKRPPKKK
jgi:YidC/Oxa1 family membrane protein insertase